MKSVRLKIVIKKKIKERKLNSKELKNMHQLHLITQIKFQLLFLQQVVEYLLLQQILLLYCYYTITTVIGAPVGTVKASFTLMFSFTTGIIKNLLGITRNKKKNLDKKLALAKSKLNSIEALVDMERSLEKFITNLNMINMKK